jgi:hypothetical protein
MTEVDPKVPPQPVSAWVSRRWRWLYAAVAVIAATFLIVVGVRWLASDDPQQGADTDTDVEAQWDSTIHRLGIEPIYPPQEDLVVGDVLVTVIGDEEQHPSAHGRKVSSSTHFLANP